MLILIMYIVTVHLHGVAQRRLHKESGMDLNNNHSSPPRSCL